MLRYSVNIWRQAQTDEAEGNENESKNYYLEEESFKAKGIPEESLRFADEDTRRLVLQKAGLQYEDFKGYFVEFDLAQKWMNRTENDLTMLQEILKTLEENPDMLKRGITEWTDGKIMVISKNEKANEAMEAVSDRRSLKRSYFMMISMRIDVGWKR